MENAQNASKMADMDYNSRNVVQNSPKRYKMSSPQNGPKCLKIPNSGRKTAKNGCIKLEMPPPPICGQFMDDGRKWMMWLKAQKWLVVAKNDGKLPKMERNGPKWDKIAQNKNRPMGPKPKQHKARQLSKHGGINKYAVGNPFF